MTRILVTIGPESANRKSIISFSKYTKLFRLNGSHSDLKWHETAISLIRKNCKDSFILMDIPGVKPRTNNPETIKINLNESIFFGKDTKENNFNGQKIELTKNLPFFKKENMKTFSLNDGQHLFDFQKGNKNYILGKSRSSFNLLPKKGINIPGSKYNEKLQLQIYKKFIYSVKDLDIDGFGLSFVQTTQLVKEVRKIAPSMILVSKIENSEGLRNNKSIIYESDAVMIDRGDLAAEIGYDNLFNAVEAISRNTKSFGKSLIMATENLESMIQRNVPSKSEVMSISHSVSIGADCIMLSEETAISSMGLNTVKWLKNYLIGSKIVYSRNTYLLHRADRSYLWKMIEELDDLPIILISKSGYALSELLSVRPNSDFFLVTENKRVISNTKFYSGNIIIIKRKVQDNTPIETVWNVIKVHKNEIFKTSNKVVAIYVSKYAKGIKNIRANCVTIFDKDDFK